MVLFAAALELWSGNWLWTFFGVCFGVFVLWSCVAGFFARLFFGLFCGFFEGFFAAFASFGNWSIALSDHFFAFWCFCWCVGILRFSDRCFDLCDRIFLAHLELEFCCFFEQLGFFRHGVINPFCGANGYL